MAETDAKLDAVKADSEQQLSASRTYLETLITDLDKELSTQISENGRLITELREDLTALGGTVAENTAAITRNTESIQEHARQIAANSQSITANREDIDANSGLIAENKQLIDKNAGLIADNQEAIRVLQSEMGTAQADILANAAAIAKNAENISKNAGLIASNASAIADNLAAITRNTADITQLKTDLEVAKTDLTAAYTAAIEKAITELDGKIEGELAAEMATLNSRVTSEVAAIDNKISTLATRVTAVEESVAEIQEAITGIRAEISELQERLEKLMGRVQSLSYIPTRSDGAAEMTFAREGSTIKAGSATLSFAVKPADAAGEIVALWEEALTAEDALAVEKALTAQAVYTETVSRAVVSYVEMPVTAVVTETEGVVSVTLSGKNLSTAFFEGSTSASVAVTLSDGNNDLTTAFVPLTAKEETEIVEVDPTKIYIPDARFKQYLLTNYDLDGNSEISQTEAESIEIINATNLGIEDLTGMEVMTNLRTVNVSGNAIEHVNVSTLKNLESLTLYGNPVRTLNISNCSLLARCFLQDASRNAVSETTFSVSGYDQATGLVLAMNDTPFETVAVTDSPGLLTLDVQNCNALRTLTCTGNEGLRTVNFSTTMETINCWENPSLASIDVVNVSGLVTLDVHNCALTGLNCTRNGELATLNCDSNRLTSLNVQSNLKLVSLDCKGNDIERLDVSHNSLLERLEASNNALLAINVRSNPALKYLAVNNNPAITVLNVSYNPELQALGAGGLAISELNLVENGKLTMLCTLKDENLSLVKLSDGKELTDDMAKLLGFPYNENNSEKMLLFSAKEAEDMNWNDAGAYWSERGGQLPSIDECWAIYNNKVVLGSMLEDCRCENYLESHKLYWTRDSWNYANFYLFRMSDGAIDYQNVVLYEHYSFGIYVVEAATL